MEMLKKIAGKIWRALPNTARIRIIRTTQVTFTVSAGAVIVNNEGKVLLLDHVLRPASGWGVPGGFINYGEQADDAVKREIFEETGLEIENVEFVFVRTQRRHVEIIFRATASGDPTVKNNEINGFGWFEIDKTPPEMSDAQRDMIQKALSKVVNS